MAHRPASGQPPPRKGSSHSPPKKGTRAPGHWKGSPLQCPGAFSASPGATSSASRRSTQDTRRRNGNRHPQWAMIQGSAITVRQEFPPPLSLRETRSSAALPPRCSGIPRRAGSPETWECPQGALPPNEKRRSERRLRAALSRSRAAPDAAIAAAAPSNRIPKTGAGEAPSCPAPAPVPPAFPALLCHQRRAPTHPRPAPAPPTLPAAWTLRTSRPATRKNARSFLRALFEIGRFLAEISASKARRSAAR